MMAISIMGSTACAADHYLSSELPHLGWTCTVQFEVAKYSGGCMHICCLGIFPFTVLYCELQGSCNSGLEKEGINVSVPRWYCRTSAESDNKRFSEEAQTVSLGMSKQVLCPPFFLPRYL